MHGTYEQVSKDVATWAGSHGITVHWHKLPPGKAGEFNGLTATMNSGYAPEESAYYLAHTIGSIVRWSLSRAAIQEMFNELRAAKKSKDADPARLERAIERYRAFEIESSEYAVWLLAELRHPDAIASYTNFMRADLEALTEFHRHGKAPVWHDFFARWNKAVAQGIQQVLPFTAKPIPPFQATTIEKQEILQEQGQAEAS
jgi:hypothetical protein